MTSKDFFPWKDIVIFGTLALFAVLVELWAIFRSSANLTQHLILGAVVAGMVLVPFFVLWGKLRSRPDFYTKYGTAVWTGGIKEITPSLIECAMDHYADHLSLCLPHLRREKIVAVFSMMMVEWSPAERVGAAGNGWIVDGAAGLAKDMGILVSWRGDVRSSAFFHEVHHVIGRVLLGMEPDYKHEDKEWWEKCPGKQALKNFE